MSEPHGPDLTQTSVTSGGTPRRQDAGQRLQSGELVAERYRIVSFLGRGGMGEVYRADDLTLGQSVALKFLPEKLSGNPQLLDRFRSEVRIGREVTHPNVCRIYDIGEADGRVFLTMEYVDGEDLSSLLVRIHRLPEDKAIEIARQLCMGVAAAHDRGILHRDLKPANVMLDGRGKVRITDFGIAAIAESGAAAEREGTPAYMAPELLRGEPSTVQSDLYALGLVLYELFTGKQAYQAETLRELIDLQANSTVTDPSELVAGLDDAVEQVILGCLDADPRRRPQSALAVALALPGGGSIQDALLGGETPSPQVVASLETGKRLHPVTAGLLAVAVVAAVAAVAAISAPRTLSNLAPLDKPPAVMIDRAQEVLQRIGIDSAPVDHAWGFDYSADYGRWLIANDDSPDRWNRAAQARPAFAFFWYRHAPWSLDPSSSGFSRGTVTAGNPPWSIAGEAYVSLDLGGRLRRIYVVPPSIRVADTPPVSPEYDFDPLFHLAGLDPASFTPAEPLLVHQFRVERRLAWMGVYPGDPSIPLRVEAGVADGALAYFRFVPPWELPQAPAATPDADEPTAPPPFTARVLALLARLQAVPFMLMIALIAISAYLSRRNLLAGRGDSTGAFRVAIFVAVIVGLAKWCAGQKLWLRNQFEFLDILAWGCFMGLGTWSAYVAIEPVVRRRWPMALVSWTRLTRGRFRDPLVGRSILIGLLVGALFALFNRASLLLFVTDTLWLPVFYRRIMTQPHFEYVELLVNPAVVLVQSFLWVLILVGLRRVIHREWLAALCFVPLLALMNEHIADHALSPGIVLVYAAILTVVLLRSGILTVIVAELTVTLIYATTFSADWTAWYAHGMRVIMAVLVALLMWGLVAALSPSLEDRRLATVTPRR